MTNKDNVIDLNASALIRRIYQLGLALQASSDNIMCTGDTSVLTPEDINGLKQHKAEIITILNQSAEQLDPTAVYRPEQLPLSSAQQRLWFLYQSSPQSSAYNIPLIIELSQSLDQAVLKQAFATLIERHESLRTIFGQDSNDEACQIIKSAIDTPFATHILPTQGSEQDLSEQLKPFTSRIFDLQTGPLISMDHCQIGSRYILVLNMHHIISDGWSVAVIHQELNELYNALIQGRQAKLDTPAYHYADYAIAEQKWLNHPNTQHKVEFWQNYLDGCTDLISLPHDFSRPPKVTNKGSTFRLKLPEGLKTQLEQLAQNQQVTPFILLMSAFNALLHRICGQDDICIGTPTANRRLKALESQIGFFVNTTVFRSQTASGVSLRDLLQKARNDSFSIYDHQDIPFDHILDKVKFRRSLSHSPLFQVMFTLQNFPEQNIFFDDNAAKSLSLPIDSAKFDLSLTHLSDKDGDHALFEYSTDLFSEDTIKQLSGYYLYLLQHLEQQLDCPVEDLLFAPVSKPTEQIPAKIQSQSNVIGQFYQICQDHPQSTAIKTDNQSISYQQLDLLVQQKAAALTQQGMRSGQRIGIYFDRSIDMVAAVLAVMANGCAYVPLDKSYPLERLQFMAEDAKLGGIITDDAEVTKANFAAYHCFAYHQLECPIDDIKLPTRPALPTADTPAYVIYTSGSTGQPKGVVIPHQALHNHMQWMIKAFTITEQDKVILKTPLSFDASVWELFAPLLSGATLVAAAADSHRNPEILAQQVTDHQVSILQLVPSLLEMFLSSLDATDTCHLRMICCGGEALPTSACKLVSQYSTNIELVNLYGPTEATIDATFWRADLTQPEQPVYIGQPIDNTGCMVLDSQMRPVQPGIIGELYIYGAGLALGYLEREQLTAERFVTIPHLEDYGRMYRSGDLVRQHRNGQLAYIGRTDQQVKVHGCRIETQEIETIMRQCQGIDDALVYVHKQNLQALFVSQRAMRCDKHQLREFMLDRVPEFMLPGRFTQVEQMPRLPNGKLDRKAASQLAIKLTSSQQDKPYQAPQNQNEKLVCEVFEQVLEMQEVSRDANFFEIGGNSLSIAKVLSKLKKLTNTTLSFSDVFKHPSAATLGQKLEQANNSQRPELKPYPAVTELPLSPQQVRYFASYNVTATTSSRMTTIHGQWDNLGYFEQTIEQLINQHQLFRTSFYDGDDGQIWQRIHPSLAIDIRHTSLADIDPDKHKAHMEQFIRQQPFDLTKPGQIQVVVAKDEHGGCTSVVGVFNGILDAFSGGVLEKSLQTLYDSISQQQSEQLAPLTLQYPDFCQWQFDVAASDDYQAAKKYWDKQYPASYQPFYRQAQYNSSDDGVTGTMLRFLLDEELTERAKAQAAKYESSLFIFLMGNIIQAASRFYQRNDIAIGMLYHGRENEELEQLIGYFVDMLCIRCDVITDEAFEHMLKRLNENFFSAIDARSYQYHHLAERFGQKLTGDKFPVTGLHVNNVIVPGDIRQVPADFVRDELKFSYHGKFDMNIYLHESNRGILFSMACINTVMNSEDRTEFADMILDTVQQNCSSLK